ncbi:MAG: SWIM zinc finger family protein [Thermodesulfobacteriota bacterium]|nr:SWIM zinc finger family protein [Thermodesulfobacteriota bacterium]
MSRYNYYRFPRYVSVAEKKAKAEKKIKQLKKKMPGIQPVQIEGKKIARSWWGMAWNKNLESYADFSNRIGRGRSYVCHGAVLDLQIQPGKILSLVQGSRSTPYTVEVKIKKIKPALWQAIIEKCRGRTESLNDLVNGRLPKVMADLLTSKKEGMFPGPGEIDFDCSCPDFAYMCKHVAATLYGVGARLDRDPSLFFSLRGVKMEDLVSQAIHEEAEQLIKKAAAKTSGRIIKDADLSSEFGIDLEFGIDDDITPEPGKSRSVSPKKRDKGIGKEKKSPGFETVVRLIERRTVNPISVKEIKARTGFEDVFIRNSLARAKKMGRIKNPLRGMYKKA